MSECCALDVFGHEEDHPFGVDPYLEQSDDRGVVDGLEDRFLRGETFGRIDSSARYSARRTLTAALCSSTRSNASNTSPIAPRGYLRDQLVAVGQCGTETDGS